MAKQKSFADILSEVAPANALALEKKACTASILAKKFPTQARRLYRVKDVAIRQLCLIQSHQPIVRGTERVAPGWILCSILLIRTRRLLHVPHFVLGAVSPRRVA